MGSFISRRATTMNKLVAAIFFFGISVGSIRGKSSKKGLCIPPGTNFHCGDLAAFDNVSWWYNWHVKPNHEKTPPEDFCLTWKNCRRSNRMTLLSGSPTTSSLQLSKFPHERVT